MSNQQALLEHVAEAALALKPGERVAFLDEACRKNPELRRPLEKLLGNAARHGSTAPTPSPYSPETSTGSTYGAFDGSFHQNGPTRSDSALVSRLSIGEILGDRFLVIRFIANGGMGEVYEVEDLSLEGVHLALKTVLPRIADDPTAQKRFRREVLLAREVVHPHLCPIYDIFHYQHRGQPLTFFTMKLVSGETVTARIQKQGHIDIPEATLIVAQVASALTAIHDAGILHRDIKASNIMLDGVGEKVCATVMDFGLAHTDLARNDASTTRLAGTPAYMSPELFRGEAPTRSADVYAFGVVVYQMLTGRLPDRGSADEFNLAKDSAFLALHPKWQELIRGCLQRDPALRYQSVSSAAAVVAPQSDTSTRRPPAHLSRRHMIQLGAGASVALATGIWLDWPNLDQKLEQWTHPLPKKRFVALLDWPAPSDSKLKPLLSGVLDAIASELQRAEAFDRDLYIIAQKTTTDLTTSAQVNEARESVGANLVLAATGRLRTRELELVLQVLDPSTNRSLRERKILVAADQLQSLAEKAVRAAATLLNINGFEPDNQRTRPATNNPDAFAAFQAAEALKKQDNDIGLDAAIEKYKQALELDPHYATAQARLAWAYLRAYGTKSDPAALSLARENAQAAIAIDPTVVDAHVGLAWAAHEMGESQLAATEISKALHLDPSDPHTLLYQGYIYTENGQWKEAETTLTRLTKLRTNYWLAHNQLAWLFESQGKYAQALFEYRKAGLLLPSSALVCASIGAILLDTGKLPDAASNFRRSYQLKPNAEASIGLAEINRVLGNFQEAIRFAEDAVRLGPSVASDWLELGDCLASLRSDRKGAPAAFRRANEIQEDQVKTEPKNGSGWMLLALSRAKAGLPGTSASLLAKAEALGASDVGSQLIKVRLLALLNRRDEAFETMASAVARGATSFQFKTMPDLESLRSDPRYGPILMSNASTTDNGPRI